MLSGQQLLRYCRLRVISVQAQISTRQSSDYKSKSPSCLDINKYTGTRTNTKTHEANRISGENRQFRNNFRNNNVGHIQNTAQFRGNIGEHRAPRIDNTNRRMGNPSRMYPMERDQMAFTNNFQSQRNDPGRHGNDSYPSKQFRGSWELNNRESNQRVNTRKHNMPYRDGRPHQSFQKKLFYAAQDIGKAVERKSQNSITAELMQQVQGSHRPATNQSAFASRRPATNQSAFASHRPATNESAFPQDRQSNVDRPIPYRNQGEEIESDSWSHKLTAGRGFGQQTRTPFTKYKAQAFSKFADILHIPEATTKCDDHEFEMKTWDSELQKYFKFRLRHAPQNGFEEMIQLTEKGLLWKFPIDNEQGIEYENNVHFTEHVFLDRHLEDWCPQQGPIRHFMDLVCIGLSSNPYLTVDDKIDHIMWYRDYFADKSKLLLEVGAITEEIPKNENSVKE